MKRHLLWIIPLLIVVDFALFPMATRVVEWDGKTRKTISVRVVDNYTNRAVSGATVYLRLPIDRTYEKAVSADEFQKFLRDQSRLVTTGTEPAPTWHQQTAGHHLPHRSQSARMSRPIECGIGDARKKIQGRVSSVESLIRRGLV